MSNWHSDTMEGMTTKSMTELVYIRDDCYCAARAGETLDNPKTGQYWDEYHYACMEIQKRISSCISQ